MGPLAVVVEEGGKEVQGRRELFPALACCESGVHVRCCPAGQDKPNGFRIHLLSRSDTVSCFGENALLATFYFRHQVAGLLLLDWNV